MKRNKEEREMKKLCDLVFENYCFICKQRMEHITDLIWICKNCELVTSIEHIYRFVDGKKKVSELIN